MRESNKDYNTHTYILVMRESNKDYNTHIYTNTLSFPTTKIRMDWSIVRQQSNVVTSC